MTLTKRPGLLRRIINPKVFFVMIFGVLVPALIVLLYINRGPQNTSTYTGPRKVSIEKKNGRWGFYKDGKPFLVKGAAGSDHIKELWESGGNTIMVWDTAK
jgi:hypothetical protein